MSASRQARDRMSERAKERELLRLASSAGVSPQEASARRQAGERWCSYHGWYHASGCPQCKRLRKRRDAQIRSERHAE